MPVAIVPVRHHSPAAALQVERLVRARRPRAILVEGPADATGLIPLLLDPETIPPVALYAYLREQHDVRAAYWPFCDYSPEYVALRVGQQVGASLQFFDVPASVALRAHAPRAAQRRVEEGEQAPAPDPEEPAPRYAQFSHALAHAAGFDDFEEFWEAAFEQEGGAIALERYCSLLADLGTKSRAFAAEGDLARDAERERHMAAAVRGLLADGALESEILVVCGAAHADALSALLDAPEPASAPSTTAPAGGGSSDPSAVAELALIPYSFPRLGEQSGYGAGNRAPWYYQQVWELRGDFGAATRRALALLARHLRERGQPASLAQTLDAYLLAQTLAAMREKLAPGVDELRDAALACFGQGAPLRVASALQEVLVGERLGRITYRVGRTPLQAEFYATAQRLRLPTLDAPRQVLVHLADATEAGQSAFLHRLVVADVPYARELQGGLGGGGRAASGGPLESLGRVREKWELQWTPATDARLIERTAWGSTLAEVCGRLLTRQVDEAPRVDVGTEALLRMVLCDLARSDRFLAALERCDALAADSGSFPALARAAYHLDSLLAYGSARRLPAERLTGLTTRLFDRAVLHLASAARCGDEDAEEVQRTLVALHDLVRRGSAATRGGHEAFWDAVAALAEQPAAHPSLRGLALVLLEMAGRLERAALAARLRYWLSAASDAADNARLIGGLFTLHRGTLVRDRALIGAVTDFLLELEVEQLIPLLPVLRRGLGGLSTSERAYLGEALSAVLGLEQAEAARALAVSSDELLRLREADRVVAAVLADWEERYGIHG